MGRISLLDTMEETMIKFSNGNPGEMQTLDRMKLKEHYPEGTIKQRYALPVEQEKH